MFQGAARYQSLPGTGKAWLVPRVEDGDSRLPAHFIRLLTPKLSPRTHVAIWISGRLRSYELLVMLPTWQVRGHVQESQVTISYAIGRNSTEGRTHTMCIEGTQGKVVGDRGRGPTSSRDPA
jgi:hypothetical protein